MGAKVNRSAFYHCIWKPTQYQNASYPLWPSSILNIFWLVEITANTETVNSIMFKISLYFINQQCLHTVENYVATQKECLVHVWVLGPCKPHQGPLLLSWGLWFTRLGTSGSRNQREDRSNLQSPNATWAYWAAGQVVFLKLSGFWIQRKSTQHILNPRASLR